MSLFKSKERQFKAHLPQGEVGPVWRSPHPWVVESSRVGCGCPGLPSSAEAIGVGGPLWQLHSSPSRVPSRLAQEPGLHRPPAPSEVLPAQHQAQVPAPETLHPCPLQTMEEPAPQDQASSGADPSPLPSQDSSGWRLWGCKDLCPGTFLQGKRLLPALKPEGVIYFSMGVSNKKSSIHPTKIEYFLE